MTLDEEMILFKHFRDANIQEYGNCIFVEFDKLDGWEIGFDILDEISRTFGTKQISIRCKNENGTWLSDITFDEGYQSVQIQIAREGE